MAAIDIIFNTDIEIENGDIKIGESGQQHICHILEVERGQFYQYPEIGWGGRKYLNSDLQINKAKKEIKQTLELDIFIVNEVKIGQSNGDIYTEIDAQEK